MDDNEIPDDASLLGEIEQAIQATTNAAENAAAARVGEIQMVEVQSTDILAWGYDPIGFRLQIQFRNGRMYLYEGISPLEFEQLSLSGSKGQAFWALVRRNPVAHPFTRLA